MGKIRYTDGWEGRDAQFNLKVGEEYFHYQAKRVLPEELRNKFLSALNNEVTLTTTKRKVKSINYNGINADSLNKSVRYSLNQKFNNNYNYGIYVEELYFEDGIVRWGKKKKGFDFGFLDVENTLIKFRNKCF